MSHGSQTLASTRASCPEWCIATHADGDRFHLQQDVAAETIYRRPVNISAYWDEKNNRPGVYIGEYELTPTQAAYAAGIIQAVADLAKNVPAGRAA